MSRWPNILRLVNIDGHTLGWFKVATSQARPAELIADPDGQVFELVALSRIGQWWNYRRTSFHIDDKAVGAVPRLSLDQACIRPTNSADEPLAEDLGRRSPLAVVRST